MGLGLFFLGDGVREEREMMGCWGKQAWEERTRK